MSEWFRAITAVAASSSLLIQQLPIFAKTEHLEQYLPAPQIVYQYHLKAVADVDLNANALSKFSAGPSLAPAVNDRGWGIANSRRGGLLYHPEDWEYCPQINNITINIHSINNNGDLLVSLARSSDSLEWMIWPWKDGGYGGARRHVCNSDPFMPDITLAAFNDQGTIAGFKSDEGKNKPFLWRAECNFIPLGGDNNVDIDGVIKCLNNVASTAGIVDNVSDRYPFFYSDITGLETLRQYRSVLEPKGWVEFADLVLSDDDTVYGTYWIKHLTVGDSARRYNPYYAYEWHPHSGNVKVLDLQGMRIADVNNHHILVGSLNGKAAICEVGHPPLELATLVDYEQANQWELIEACGINDKGQITGYGKYKGKMHVFFADLTN